MVVLDIESKPGRRPLEKTQKAGASLVGGGDT